MKNHTNTTNLIISLNNIQHNWQLTPVAGKAPYINHWNIPRGFVNRDQITLDIKSGRATGYGVLSGIHSTGLLLIDVDGASALKHLCNEVLKTKLPNTFDFAAPTSFADLLELEILPSTTSWYSGKPGRGQLAFSVPKNWWGCVRSSKISTRKDEALEIRWGSQMSVLPPSFHPETESPYLWGNDCSVGLADIRTCEPLARLAIGTQRPASNIDKAIAHLWGLANIRYDDYTMWKAVGMALKYEADASNDPGKLEEHWHVWSAQSDKYDERAAEHKWDSFKDNSDRAVKVGSLIDWSKEDDWESPWDYYGIPKDKPKFQNTKSKSDYLNDPEFKADIEAYINASLDNTAKIAALKALTEKYSIGDYDLREYITARAIEIDKAENLTYLKADVEKLLHYTDIDVDVEQYLPEKLAREIKLQATRRGFNQAPYLFTLITAVSAFMKVGTRVLMKKSEGYKTPINVFMMLLGEPSSGKSEVLNTIFTTPIEAFKYITEEEFTKAKVKYASDKKNYDKAVKDENPTLDANFPRGDPKSQPAPRERIIFITNTTVEAIWKQFQAHPTRGILMFYHELPSLFKSANMFKNGKGNDTEEIMNAYDCAIKNVIRAADTAGASFVLREGTQLSIAGAIQPGPFKDYYGDGSDPNGNHSRWIVIPVKKTTIYDDPNIPDEPSENPDEDTPLTAILKELYLKLDEIPKLTYQLSAEAYKVYVEASNSFKQQTEECNNNGLKAYLGKCDKQIGTYAAILHILHHVCRNPDQPMNTMISKAAMIAAIELTEYTINTQKLVYQTVLNVGNEQESAELVKIIELSKKKNNWITVRDVNQKIWKYKHAKRPEIEKIFKELETTLNKGRTRLINKKLEYHWENNGSTTSSPSPEPTDSPNRSTTSSPSPEPTDSPNGSDDFWGDW